ncbi:hypothetical protein PMI08_01974 [Brevibacillus sp. CF112]|nr:hypothetical protein PMI08_01974 [Brevibacillus sp. CF112]
MITLEKKVVWGNPVIESDHREFLVFGCYRSKQQMNVGIQMLPPSHCFQ